MKIASDESKEVINFQIVGGHVFMLQLDNSNPRITAPVEFPLSPHDLKARIINREMRGEDASISRKALRALQAALAQEKCPSAQAAYR